MSQMPEGGISQYILIGTRIRINFCRSLQFEVSCIRDLYGILCMFSITRMKTITLIQTFFSNYNFTFINTQRTIVRNYILQKYIYIIFTIRDLKSHDVIRYCYCLIYLKLIISDEFDYNIVLRLFGVIFLYTSLR